MSKAVLISINPKWCELIASGKKTIEIRKTKPKLETSFKCYIYQTNPKKRLIDVIKNGDEIYGETYHGKTQFIKTDNDGCHLAIHPIYKEYGKVIGKFTCDKISEYEAEFYEGDNYYQDIKEVLEDEDGVNYKYITSNEEQYPEACDLCVNSCLTFNEIKEYIGKEKFDFSFYGWHISDLVIYDEPKELSEFWIYCDRCGKRPIACEFAYEESNENGYYSECKCDFKRPIRRPPQSWCYVEDKKYV